MPQLDISTYSSQIFWLLLSFGALFIIVNNYIVPRFTSLFSQRENQESGNKLTTEKIYSEISNIERQMSRSIYDAKIQAKQIVEQASLLAKEEREKQLRSLDKTLQKSIKESQKRIEDQTKMILEEICESIDDFIEIYSPERPSTVKIPKDHASNNTEETLN